ncbi:putative domain 1-containing protein [Thermodesulfobium acidiphilum]|uniref:Acyl-coenzyme A thioesterase THEM4 n=1 Tax=Thermodesulfobium acidiphilum TaxID=1794699 RepID=A0A2R4W2X4_THEAF|nr:PaaI family thioesterase [Thermodesulfobium acidiphilum]AWB11068.1 putative domain 1-containing protein [Thermodesulfobium acidiphilum]
MLIADDWCFACGKANPLGLRLEISQDEESVLTTFQFQKSHQGWNNIVHGGIISTILDELSTWAAVRLGYKVVTAQLTVKFKKPIYIGTNVMVSARVTEDKGRLIYAQSQIESIDKTILYATGLATLSIIR